MTRNIALFGEDAIALLVGTNSLLGTTYCLQSSFTTEWSWGVYEVHGHNYNFSITSEAADMIHFRDSINLLTLYASWGSHAHVMDSSVTHINNILRSKVLENLKNNKILPLVPKTCGKSLHITFLVGLNPETRKKHIGPF